MKRLLVFLSVAILAVSVSAANIRPEKRYISSLTKTGWLYFIRPDKMDMASGSKALKPLKYDITYLTSEDSVSFTVTVVTAQPVRGRSCSVICQDKAVNTDLEVVYLESHRGKYTNRLRFYITWDELRRLYSSATPYLIDLGEGLRFSHGDSKWRKEKEVISQIIQLIEINKESK